MDLTQLQQALRQLPKDTLLTEIPEVQNSIKHLLQSNKEMREYDPEGKDPDLTQAIEENQQLMERHEARIDATLRIIRERIGEAAGREMASNVIAFRKEYPTKPDEEEGVLL